MVASGPHSTSKRANSRADLLEHPQVATGNSGARPIQRGCRIDDAPNGRERLADRAVRAESARLHPDLARSTRRVRRRSECRVEAALEILLPDRPSGLLRCPRREGAPVGDFAEARRRRGRKLVIGLRDLEVADHRIGDGSDLLNVLRGQRAVPGERRCRHGKPAVYRPGRPPNRPGARWRRPAYPARWAIHRAAGVADRPSRPPRPLGPSSASCAGQRPPR